MKNKVLNYTIRANSKLLDKNQKKELIEVEIAAYFQRLRSATKTNLNTHTKKC